MEELMLLGMAAGFAWGMAGILGYPGVSWKPGAFLTVAAAIWLLRHDAMPPEPYIEAAAIGIFLLLNHMRGRLYPTEKKATEARQGTGAPPA